MKENKSVPSLADIKGMFGSIRVTFPSWSTWADKVLAMIVERDEESSREAKRLHELLMTDGPRG